MTQNKKRKIKTSTKIKLIILFAVLTYTIIMMANQQIILEQQLEKQNELLEEKAELEAEKYYNENKLDYIGTDNYIIKEAKDRLGWLFENETKYIIEE